jgi:acetolactate decarboxylase
MTHGNTGLGALDGNDGELVIDQGVAWRSAADGTTHQLDGAATSPYATVIPFSAEHHLDLDQQLDSESFEDYLAEALPLRNRIWALRIHGTFTTITAGASLRQPEPTRRLAEVMNEYRRHTWCNTSGTLVGFHCPIYLSGIDYVGAHYHWLSDDHQEGGHVFAFTTSQVTIEACQAHAYMTQLPDVREFHGLDLSPFHVGA